MKNRQAILLLFIANAVSGVAQGISMLAIPWYFAREGDMGRFGLVYVVTNVISFFWVPYAGTLIDHFNRKHLFLALTAISGTLLFIVSGYGFRWAGLPWFLVASIFMVTFLNYNLHYPTLYTFVQEITEQRHYSWITSVMEVMNQVTSILAGAGAAILLEGTSGGSLNIFGFQVSVGWEIASWTIYEIFLLDGGTYVASFLIILFIRYVPLAERHSEGGSLLHRLRVGYNWLKDHPNIFLFGVASYSIFVTVLLMLFYLGAKYVSDHLLMGGDVYAASEMYFALGSLLAGVAIHHFFKWTTRPMAVIITTLTAGMIFAVLAATQGGFIFYFMLFLLGFTNAGTRVLRTTYLFNHIPNQVFGRSGSTFFLTNIVFRTAFLLLFSLPFFQRGHNVVYAMGMLSVFLFLSAGVMGRYYQKLIE
jgi:DHA3 family macrolide efflux protein-like MFS transporter